MRRQRLTNREKKPRLAAGLHYFYFSPFATLAVLLATLLMTTLLLLAGLLLSTALLSAALLATALLAALLLLARFLVRILILIHFYSPTWLKALSITRDP